jgi:RHS repeat-associated protein
MAKTEQTAPPSGTGNMPGLGESFSINFSTGQGTYTCQMPLPEGVAKHTPRLVLEYNHGGGHGAWGLGWRLALRVITVALDFGTPDAGLAERFLCDGAEIMPSADGSFRALRETAFSRYTRQGQGWKLEERNGQVHEFGLSAAARVAHPDHPERMLEWLIEHSTDVSGNSINYTYSFDGGFAYPATIRYAAYEVRFGYEDRPDVRRDGRMGFERRRTKRCASVALVLDPGPGERVIRSWAFTYTQQASSLVSLLAEVRLTSHGTAADGSLDVARPPLRFGYSKFDAESFRLRWIPSAGTAPPPLTDEDVALVTLDDAPLPGVLMNRDGRQYYWANRGADGWAAPRPLPRAPLVSSFARDGLAFVDMDGSGTADLMVADPDAQQGYYQNGGREGWSRFVAFPRGRRSTPQWSDASLRLLDANGDGLVDAMVARPRSFVWWRNEGTDGWSQPLLIPKESEDLLDLDLSGPDIFVADMTGDGLADIVRIRSGRIEYWPNLGRGRFGAAVVMRNSPRLRQDTPNATLLLADLDGDGCADLVHFSAQGLTIYLNQNGTSFAAPTVIGLIPSPIAGTVRAVNLAGGAGTGLAWNSRTSRDPGYVQFNYEGAQPYLLTQIANGAGLISEIRYRSAIEDHERDRRDGIAWTTNFPFPYLVVAGTSERDQVSGRVVEVEYRYHEAHFEPSARQFQGFRRTERIEKGDASRPDTRQVHHFLMAQERVPGNGREAAALNGAMSRLEIFQMDGSALQDKPYRVEIADHALKVLDAAPDGRKRVFVFVTTHREEDSERTDDVRVEEKRYSYDNLGNVVREVRHGSGRRAGVDQPVRELTTDIAYATSATHYLLDKPARITMRDAGGQLVSEKRFQYDGDDFVGLPNGQAGRGLTSRIEDWILTQAAFDAHYGGMDQAALGYIPAPNADGVASVFAVTQRNAYDARGLQVASRDPLGTTTSYGFDPGGLFRIGMTDPLGATQFLYDRASGQVTRITYADGGVAQFAHDAQGRVLHSALPGQDIANPAASYVYDETSVPNRRIARMRLQDGSFVEAATYFDGYGKEFQQRVPMEVGQFLVSGLKLYNSWGDLLREFEPSFATNRDFALPATNGVPSRSFFYDARGRVVRTVNFNSGVSSAEYTPFRVVTRDANDNDNSPENGARGQFDTPHEEEFDVFRYLLRVTERTGPGRQTVTDYGVGPMGELLSVRDARSQKMAYSYDRQGNRLVASTRESGERRIFYDARRKPVRTVDGAGHDIRATWDAVGRLLTLTSAGAVLESYTYDTPARHALGRLAEVSYTGGRQVFDYDPAGRLVQRSYHYDGEVAPQTLRYEYDALGRQTALIHTDGTRIERQLTANGWLKALVGVIDAVGYDPRGLPSEVRFHNGVTTTYAYTPGPGRISQQKTVAPGGGALEDVAYVYDKMEVMLSSNDTAPGGVGLRQYAYDPLYQLTRMASVEGGNPVQRHYDYADNYNLQRFEEARSALHYDDAEHADRLSGITPDGGARFDLQHDGNGNILALPGQSYAYNAKNELVRLTAPGGLVADYGYDHLGLRMSKRVNDGHGHVTRTLFVGDQAEVRDGVPAHFVKVGPLRVAVLTGGTIRYVHENGIGSTTFLTDAAGQRTGTVDTHPFGNLASTTGTVDHRTFSLHPVDPESGLVYMRRRYYAPAIGRFLGPDLLAIYQPEKFLHAPQHLHLYAFVANDPMNKTDPTGLSFWSFIGSVVGVVVGVIVAIAIVAVVVATGGVAGILIGIGLALGASLAVTGVSYLIASNVDPNSGFGQFMRGFMIGFNAGMNGVLATAIFGPVVGVTLGVIGFLATFDGIAKNSTYQGILGWTSWLMPMSWGATGLGIVFFVVNLVIAGVTGNQWNAAKIDKLAIDWKTGAIVMVGGLIRGPTAFDLGNFVFMNPNYVDGSSPDRTYDAVLRHETGHTLEVGAFGSAFLVADFIGENIVGAGTDDYGEKIAESHANRGPATIPMWG